MPVEISDAPRIVEAPAFAGTAILVPLTEAPDPGWHREFLARDLPGKGHRVVDGGIEFYLDREAKDVNAAMRKIADAIESTNGAYGPREEAGRDAAKRRDEGLRKRREKLDQQMQAWWEDRQKA